MMQNIRVPIRVPYLTHAKNTNLTFLQKCKISSTTLMSVNRVQKGHFLAHVGTRVPNRVPNWYSTVHCRSNGVQRNRFCNYFIFSLFQASFVVLSMV